MAKSSPPALEPLALGVDIGGTGTKFGIVDRNGNVLFSSEISTKKHKQVETFIDELYEKHGILKLLDYGAGKGRLLANLTEDAESVDQIKTKINYVAYDNFSVERETCESFIAKVYGLATDRFGYSRVERFIRRKRQ